MIRGTLGNQVSVHPLDATARAVVTRYIETALPSVKGAFKDDLSSPEDILDFVKKNIAFVVGSSQSNRALPRLS